MDDDPGDLAFSENDLATLSGSNGVLVLTDAGREDVLVLVRRVAARLAVALDTTLYLADRSVRTWTETPHVRGPSGIDELRELGIDYMVQQIEEANAVGAHDVRGLAPSIPTFDALRDSLEVTGAGIVVIPTKLDHLRVLDRAQLHGDLSAAVKDAAGDRHVVVVDRDGAIRVI